MVAGFDPDEVHHPQVMAVLAEHRGLLVVSPYIVAELDHILRRRIGVEGTRAVLDELCGGAFELAVMPEGLHRRAVDIDKRYADLGLGIADASLIVLSNEYDDHDLLTLDERHFRAVRPIRGGAFRILPADRPTGESPRPGRAQPRR